MLIPINVPSRFSALGDGGRACSGDVSIDVDRLSAATVPVLDRVFPATVLGLDRVFAATVLELWMPLSLPLRPKLGDYS